MVVAELQCTRQQMVHVHALVNDLAGCRLLAFVNKVATAKLFRREPNCSRHLIHVSFECEDALRRAEPSKSAVRWNIGSDSAAVNPYVRTDVWAGSVDRSARKHDRRQRAISAAVDHKVNLSGKELAIFLNRSFMTRA